MVYCGKPSRGCQMCRTRRIKCDETKPTCTQCQKSRRPCPGYKDEFDIVFRNETKATEMRARRAVNSKRLNTEITFAHQQAKFATINSDGETELSPIQLIPKSDSDMLRALVPTAALSIPLEVQAPCYFISNFTLSSGPAARGHFDFILPLSKTESADSPFALAFAAVAFVSLANRPSARSKELMYQACVQYQNALKAVNLALQNPAQQKTDQTLAAILLLGFFETLSSERTTAMAWYSHIDGAVQLVKMRGKKQLRTKIGHALFNYVRNQMTVTCMSGSKAPMLGTEWWICDAGKDERIRTFLPGLSLRIAELRADINVVLTTCPHEPAYFPKVREFIKRAQGLEAEYHEWEATLPDSFRPQTAAWIDNGGDLRKAEVFPGKIDMYSDIWLANMWNTARVARLFIAGVVIRCAAWICSPVDYRTTPEYAAAARLSQDLMTDVIASIPYHLGWRVNENGVLKEGHSAALNSEEGFESPKALGGYFCMWPLFCATNSDFVTDAQRTWAKGRLLFISEILGLNQAKVLANYTLRLPYMIIIRDRMARLPAHSQAAAMAAYQRASASPSFSNNPSPHMTTVTIDKMARSESESPMMTPSSSINAGFSGKMEGMTMQSQAQGYALGPLQQRERDQREKWEKERKELLKKASGTQGDSVERLLANYLAV